MHRGSSVNTGLKPELLDSSVIWWGLEPQTRLVFPFLFLRGLPESQINTKFKASLRSTNLYLLPHKVIRDPTEGLMLSA